MYDSHKGIKVKIPITKKVLGKGLFSFNNYLKTKLI